MAISKVVYGDDTLIDLTSDTVSADSVLEGVSFHSANGESGTGTVVTAPIDDTTTSTSKVWSSSKTDSMLDSWHTYQNRREEIVAYATDEDITISFHEVRSDYCYRLMANNSDGSMVTVKSSSYTDTSQHYGSGSSWLEGTMNYVVNVTTIPTTLALRKFKI